MSVATALIAGGRSTRFGSDKAFALWPPNADDGGSPLYAVQLQKLAQSGGDSLWLSANAGQDFPEFIAGVTRVIDQQPDLGPIGALHSLLEEVETSHILVLAVDMPLVPTEWLQRLIEQSTVSPEQGVVTRQAEGIWEPLVGIYPTALLRQAVAQAIAEGQLALQPLLRQAEADGWVRAEIIPTGQEGLFENFNRAEQLAQSQYYQLDESIVLTRYRLGEGYRDPEPDFVAQEEPLELRVNGRSVAVTMRTPGHDEELAVGFLHTEQVLHRASDIIEIVQCPEVDPEGLGNTLEIRLEGAADLDGLTRHVFTSSSCGVCGKATIDSVFQSFPPISDGIEVDPEVILTLPEKLREKQSIFDRTGGLHASALFTREGELLLIREDVGRHNALDKVIGRALLDGIDLSDSILLVSGRVSFELMQKSLAGRLPIVAGISAPSSLAVKLAKDSRQTLIGFLRGGGFNRYA
ncbi:MAG: formate dehydrogenase accessory sulfurtransferase FdhD [Verrucomicrobiota bacterium]